MKGEKKKGIAKGAIKNSVLFAGPFFFFFFRNRFYIVSSYHIHTIHIRYVYTFRIILLSFSVRRRLGRFIQKVQSSRSSRTGLFSFKSFEYIFYYIRTGTRACLIYVYILYYTGTILSARTRTFDAVTIIYLPDFADTIGRCGGTALWCGGRIKYYQKGLEGSSTERFSGGEVFEF